MQLRILHEAGREDYRVILKNGRIFEEKEHGPTRGLFRRYRYIKIFSWNLFSEK